MRSHHRLPLAVLLAALGPAIVTCTEDGSGGDPAAQLEAAMASKYEDIPAYALALQRLMLHLSGTPQPGVAVTITATGGTGSVSVDTDGDGTLESTIEGSLTFNNPSLGIAGGATVEITEIAGTGVDITSGLEVYDVGIVQFTTVEATIPGGGGRPRITVFDGSLYVDASAPPGARAQSVGLASARSSWPFASGYMEFEVGDESAFAEIFTDETNVIRIIVYIGDSQFELP